MRTYQTTPGGVSDVGIIRPTNEDSWSADGDIFIVADGMGGPDKGHTASSLAVTEVQAGFRDEPTADGIVAALQRANGLIANQGIEGMGTTIAVAAIVDTEAGDRPQFVIANIGDSRVYLFRDGQLRLLSHDHSKVADLVRSGELTSEQAAIHPERHVLTQAIGVGAEIDPFITQLIPARGDRLLLCSDGLFNEVPDAEITQVLAHTEPSNEAAAELVGLANHHGGSDNTTVVVVNIN